MAKFFFYLQYFFFQSEFIFSQSVKEKSLEEQIESLRVQKSLLLDSLNSINENLKKLEQAIFLSKVDKNSKYVLRAAGSYILQNAHLKGEKPKRIYLKPSEEMTLVGISSKPGKYIVIIRDTIEGEIWPDAVKNEDKYLLQEYNNDLNISKIKKENSIRENFRKVKAEVGDSSAYYFTLKYGMNVISNGGKTYNSGDVFRLNEFVKNNGFDIKFIAEEANSGSQFTLLIGDVLDTHRPEIRNLYSIKQKELQAVRAVKEKELQAAREENNRKLRVERLKALTKKYQSELIASRIANHEYWVGMTSEMASDSLGEPKEINRSVYSFGVHEQWVYGTSRTLNLYFEDDLCTSFQDTR